MFSSRVPAELAPNRLAAALARARQEGGPIIDLTLSNPTHAGFCYPSDLLACLSDPRGLAYEPEPLGLLAARRAVAADFRRRGAEVTPDRIALTASTSEAYSLLFKLLGDPGDQVLVPRPSYPLFEHLARLDAMTAVPYDLEYHGAWSIDLPALERAFTSRTRAVLLVTPNNPTGSFVSPGDLDCVAAMCRTRQAAVVSDEVFADYELTPGAAAAAGHLLGRHDVLGFTLGGLSKSIGLPQAKLAWIALSGSDADVRSAQVRLELVSDTYLSVSTPVQAAAADLLQRGSAVRAQIQARIQENHRAVRTLVATVPSCELLQSDGGWSVVLRVPTLMSEEDLVLALLTEDAVLVYPGYYFDFPAESFLILSLLSPPPLVKDGLSRIVRRFDHS